QHTFADTWSKNSEYHWHAATCGCTGLVNEFAEHAWGTGDNANKCTVCGYEKEDPKPVHEHTFASDWSKNALAHWHAATCGCSGLTNDFAEHNYSTSISKGVKTYTCKTCGYQKKETLKVAVPKPSIKSLTKARKAFTVKWTKKSVTGYQIQYATNSKFTKSKKTVTVKSASTVSKKIKSLKKKKRYYVRVRCYINKYDTTYYSGWSSRKSVRTR
ncbi:MAG: hypothetical protein MJ123_12370, partial [Lachnospiraceae bacterium]|nr:hypothetical protein [Lachnospiraceae bacterium]